MISPWLTLSLITSVSSSTPTRNIPFLTVSDFDEIITRDRVAIIYSGFVDGSDARWKIPSFEEVLMKRNLSVPWCHLRFYGVTLHENLARLRSQRAKIEYHRSSSSTSQIPHTISCYYLTNHNTYTDLEVLLPTILSHFL